MFLARTALPLLLLASTSAWAGPTLAVARFDNHTTDASLEPLGRGLSDMLTTDLAGLSEVTVVERAQLSQVLDELKRRKTKFRSSLLRANPFVTFVVFITRTFWRIKNVPSNHSPRTD